jgi:ribonuclease R
VAKASPKEIRRAILHLLKNSSHRTYRPKEIARQLNYKDNQSYSLFLDVLNEMDEQDMIARVKGGKYTYKPRPATAEGILSVTSKGFGFVQVEGMEEDLYVSEHNMRSAMDGDRVLVEVAAPSRSDRRRECEVLEVLERKRTQVVGTFTHRGRSGFVQPDDNRIKQDVYVPSDAFGGAQHGDKVMVSIDDYGDRHVPPEGRVLQVIGPSSDPAVRVLSLAMSMDVRADFSPAVIDEARQIPDTIPAEEIARRLDLRHKRIFTIDPVDAKDFDDAIHLEDNGDGTFELGVHIADVSYYVRPGTALDEEAYTRGTSVYLVDRTIPMLPEKLSNVVCSLRPDEDKLTYSCIMTVTKQGRVKDYEIRETVIRSKQRFAYEDAQDIIEGGNPGHPLAADVLRAAELARTLTKKRMREGSVDFDLPEIRVVLNEKGEVADVYRKERKEAHRLIEEFMLLANQATAAEIGKRRSPPPYVYRIHDRPNAEKIVLLAQYVRAFGYDLKHANGLVASKDMNAFLQRIKERPEAPVIEEAALRAMAKAKYSTHNIGHYGLGFTHYTHFTSPIRRYPDLMVHRLLKHYLSGGGYVDAEELEARAQHSSEREKAAAEAERESVKLKQVEFIRQHVGEQFPGVVSGVTKFGVFVELLDTLVQGMVHVRELDDDYYEYDERSYRLVGRYTGKAYRLGDPVDVIVAAANLDTREVDFVFAE